MTTNTIQNTGPSAALLASMNGTATTQSTAAEAQDRFMTLLVTQMKNQDPLNPMDNAQVTSQLAQLSTVTGIDKLNGTLESLKSSYQASQSLQATSMIGHGVLIPGSTVSLGSGGAYMGADLTEAADAVKVTIRDGAGNAIHTANLGSKEIGTLGIQWDGSTDAGGTAPQGQYTFEVEATSAGKAVTGVTPLSFGSVDSVSTNAQGVMLNVQGVGAVDISTVRQIL
jgi:flagellar basal-body rod modification protein FlgD